MITTPTDATVRGGPRTSGSRAGRHPRRRTDRRTLTAAALVILTTSAAGCAAPGPSTAAPAAASATSVATTALSPALAASARTLISSPPSTNSPPSGSPSSTTPAALTPITAAPSDFGSAECYWTADALGRPTTPDNGTGVAFGFKEGTQENGEPYDNSLTTESYLDVCRQSMARNGHDPGDRTLTACVLTDGRIAVAPGDDSICAVKGLPVAQRSASGPIPSS